MYAKWAVSEGACPTRPGRISWLTAHVDLLPLFQIIIIIIIIIIFYRLDSILIKECRFKVGGDS